MAGAAQLWHPAGMKFDDISRRAAQGAVLLLPFFLFYGRAVADGLVVLTDVLFLLHAARRREWGWGRQTWVICAAVFFALELVASLRRGPEESVLQGLALVRLPLFVAALQAWALREAAARRALWWVFLGLGVWLASQCWEQYLTGHNLTGSPRWGDGSLTGAFYKPRAGEIFLFLGLAGIMPVVLGLVNGKSRLAWAGGVGLLLLTLLTMILIGQRMPNLLFVLGLVITGLIEKRFRAPMLLAIGAGVVVLIALPVISPPTFAKLVVKFTHQISDFAASPYGQLYARASVMIAAHPLGGFGFDGFRDFCAAPEYHHGFGALALAPAPDGSDAGCNLHPHNYYFQGGVMAGLPGLAAFAAMAGLWLWRMGRRLGREPAQVMVFVTCCVMLWPFASTSSLFTFDTAGWVFLMVGWGLAYARG